MAVALGWVGWLAIGVTFARLPSGGPPVVAAFGASDPRATLERLTQQITTARTAPPASVYAPIAAAAAALPLDERPFLLNAIRALAEGRDAEAVRLLEETRHRNPRQRFARLLLLDRYLRANRTAEAVREMTVLSRLMPAANGVLATAVAKFAIDPATARQTRRAMNDDPVLLNQVLATMATSQASPATLQRFAGANPPAGLGASGWRTALIAAMIARQDFGSARAFWAQTYRIPPAAAALEPYDAALAGAPGAGPFNWVLNANEVGAAEIREGAMQVEYYGRRPGPLATQLMTLAPGRYRFRYAVSGNGGDDDGGLNWAIACERAPDKPIMSSAARPLLPNARIVAADFEVPATGCAAQRLSLDGVMGEYAGSISARVTQLRLVRRS
ncbi:MAG: hypothetical protein V4659_01800 [Pseudomonadota bacterium]